MNNSRAAGDRATNPGAAPDAGSRDPQAVRAMFDRIARRYDLANHLLSAGCDFWWRRRAVTLVRQWQPHTLLDVATGSGDLALAIVDQLPHVEVTGADASVAMLEVAKNKGLTNVRVADAHRLPFASESFDVVTVAFGLRNMADWNQALREMARVLTPAGHLLVLDFSLPGRFLRPFYRFYLHRCLPFLAGVITGEKEAYQYLGASIESFPSGRAMIHLLEASGFDSNGLYPLTRGVATIYTAIKR